MVSAGLGVGPQQDKGLGSHLRSSPAAAPLLTRRPLCPAGPRLPPASSCAALCAAGIHGSLSREQSIVGSAAKSLAAEEPSTMLLCASLRALLPGGGAAPCAVSLRLSSVFLFQLTSLLQYTDWGGKVPEAGPATGSEREWGSLAHQRGGVTFCPGPASLGGQGQRLAPGSPPPSLGHFSHQY